MFLLPLFLLLIVNRACALTLNEHEKDSVRKLVCEMERKDQDVRDSFRLAKQKKDTIAMDRWGAELYITDKRNFAQLEQRVSTIGFPCTQLLGKFACYPFGILIHWSKEYPAWFSEAKNIAMFKREISLGHLPKCQIDLAYFMYVSFLPAEPKYYKLINNARIAYGLQPYTIRQLQKLDRIEPMMSDKEQPMVRGTR